MILYPSIDTLVDMADSKYTLVIASSKRARQLQEGRKPLAEVRSGKPVSTALRELELHKVSIVRTREAK
jgi:DNA-directed RNA polymerase subunit omega